jgi:hypothetical protein
MVARGPIKKSVPTVFRTDLSILFELPKSQFNFEMMYGKDSQFINTSNIIELSRSINERMLKVC